MTTIDRVHSISTRSARQGQWLDRLRASAAGIRNEFAEAVKKNDPNEIERLTTAYVNKCRFIASVELQLIQQGLERARLIRSMSATY